MDHPAPIRLFRRLLRIPWLRRPTWRQLIGLVLGAVGAVGANGQAHRIESAPPDLIETGAPRFEVRNHQTLGLEAPPTDLHVLPDGRLLLVAGPQIAIGDGVRWDSFQQAADDPVLPAVTVAVDRDGAIYMGVPGGFARVAFGADARWRLRFVAPWTNDDLSPCAGFALGDPGWR
jgi:hypothetical protein